MKNISLEMAEAYNKINRVIRSCQTLDQLGVAMRMIEQFESLFKSKPTKRWDVSRAVALHKGSESLRMAHSRKAEKFR